VFGSCCCCSAVETVDQMSILESVSSDLYIPLGPVMHVDSGGRGIARGPNGRSLATSMVWEK